MSDINLNPVSTVVNSVSRGIETVAGVFTTNKEKDAQRGVDEQMALLRAYQAEFNQRQNRNWVDSLADGFNRLVRPLIVTLVLFIFIIAYFSPEHLASITLAMSAIPDGYWALLSVIVAFYFGGRMQLKSQAFKFNESQLTAVKALIETKQAFRQLELDDDEPDTLVGEEVAKSKEIDVERALSANSIVEQALAVVGTPENRDALVKQVELVASQTPEQFVAKSRSKKNYGPRKLRR